MGTALGEGESGEFDAGIRELVEQNALERGEALGVQKFFYLEHFVLTFVLVPH